MLHLSLVPMPPLPAPFQQDQQVIPTTATIEELPSQPSPANPTASESHYRSHAVTNNAQTYHASPNQPTHQSYYPSHMYQQSRSINSTQVIMLFIAPKVMFNSVRPVLHDSLLNLHPQVRSFIPTTHNSTEIHSSPSV